jgi:antirestriction protein ArdC
MVVFWKWLDREDEETGEVKQVPYLRYYNVFHVDQCEGITAKHMQTNPNPASPDETAEKIIADYVRREGVTLEHEEGDRAFYQPSTDRIVVPTMAQFTESAEYYSTCFHELTHSTGHMKRLARLDSTANFGSEEYSKEELVAEIGSAALVHHVGLETADSFHNSAGYCQNWLQALKNDKRFIVSAAGKADKAVNLILVEGQ